MSVEVITFGCRLNAFESEVIAREADSAGLDQTIVINSCAVTNEAVAQARQSIRRLKRERPDARIVVTGCAAQTQANMFAEMREVDRVIAIGSDGMMAAVSQARQGMLAPHLKPGHKAIASINSPMQCMMKEICAQCLQVHRDPASGVESVVFSCFNQDQDLDRVDFDNLRARLNQNGVQEKLTRLWIDRSLRHLGLRQTAAE